MFCVYLCKDRGVFSGMSERVDVPGYSGTATLTERVVQKTQAQTHLIYHSTVVRSGFIAHTPSAIYELKTTFKRKLILCELFCKSFLCLNL